MYRRKRTYYKPSYNGIAMRTISDQEDVDTQVTTITKSLMKRGYKNIPVMPKLHADALTDLAKHKSRGLLNIACYIALHLSKENPETVSLRITDIADELNISEKTISTHISLLEELKYIKVIGKSLYYISPRLAFYGSAIEWSLALQLEEEGKPWEEIRSAKEKINEQIRHNELSVGVVN